MFLPGSTQRQRHSSAWQRITYLFQTHGHLSEDSTGLPQNDCMIYHKVFGTKCSHKYFKKVILAGSLSPAKFCLNRFKRGYGRGSWGTEIWDVLSMSPSVWLLVKVTKLSLHTHLSVFIYDSGSKSAAQGDAFSARCLLNSASREQREIGKIGKGRRHWLLFSTSWISFVSCPTWAVAFLASLNNPSSAQSEVLKLKKVASWHSRMSFGMPLYNSNTHSQGPDLRVPSL